MALLQIADAAGLARWIQGMRKLICAGIEFVIVQALINTNPPENDGWMIAVLQDHLLQRIDGMFFPFRIADVLPARALSKDKEP